MIRLAIILGLALVLFGLTHRGLETTGRRVLTHEELVAKYGEAQVNAMFECEERGGLSAREYSEANR